MERGPLFVEPTLRCGRRVTLQRARPAYGDARHGSARLATIPHLRPREPHDTTRRQSRARARWAQARPRITAAAADAPDTDARGMQPAHRVHRRDGAPSPQASTNRRSGTDTCHQLAIAEIRARNYRNAQRGHEKAIGQFQVAADGKRVDVRGADVGSAPSTTASHRFVVLRAARYQSPGARAHSRRTHQRNANRLLELRRRDRAGDVIEEGVMVVVMAARQTRIMTQPARRLVRDLAPAAESPG
jgi:hypothetical protein